ncbi:MAG: hypothetical protein HY270_04200 [Deltaproteobacteria bacterium]|nr:hypothetical protein [Deltaproteobacteria bacterium]
MKRLLTAAMLASLLVFTVRPAMAVPDEYDDTQSHPLRIACYLIYPVGFTMEWLLFRPFHYVVSRPGLDQVFGHRSHGESRAY